MKTINLLILCLIAPLMAEAQKYRFGAVSKLTSVSNDSGRIEIGDSILTITRYGKNKEEVVEIVNNYKIVSKKDSLIEFRIGGGEKAFLSIKQWVGETNDFSHTHGLAWLSEGKIEVFYCRRIE